MIHKMQQLDFFENPATDIKTCSGENFVYTEYENQQRNIPKTIRDKINR